VATPIPVVRATTPYPDIAISPALILLARALQSRRAAEYIAKHVDKTTPANAMTLNAISLRALRSATKTLWAHGGNAAACLKDPDCPPCLAQALRVPAAVLRRAESTPELLQVVNAKKSRDWRLKPPVKRQSRAALWMQMLHPAGQSEPNA
jgi:hypothetical protein